MLEISCAESRVASRSTLTIEPMLAIASRGNIRSCAAHLAGG